MLESTLWPLVSFGILNVLGIVLLGGSPGHRLFRMYVAAIDGTIVGLKRATIRTGLLLLVIPALVWDSDQRGFHDKVAGTVLLRQ